jgi:hypothetical protein
MEVSGQLVALNSEDHRALRLRSLNSAPRHFVEIMTSEFAAAAAYCPVLLVKNADTGAFYAGAMFGFKPGENLLAKGPDSGSPAYRPFDQLREGFYVAGDEIAIDPANPRFSESDGEPLFDMDGQPAEVLRRMQQVLAALVNGKPETEDFIATLLRLKLVEPMDVTLKFDDGERLVLQGLYTVSLDALRTLDDADVLDLFHKGYLQLIYTMTGSLKQIGNLADRRNRLLAQAA